MHRLFIALPMPVPLCRALDALHDDIAGARWVDPAQLHLTLRFVGEVDRHQAEDVAACLFDVRGPAPTVAIEGVGCFESRDRPHSLWADVPRTDALAALYHSVGRALLRAGVASETRPFRPHITVARLPRTAGPIAPWLVQHSGVKIAPHVISTMELVESELGHAGATYTTIASYPFDRSG